ncbi:MAG: ABC transporter substrate-binding protein [Candidatus Omnitrophica bacterium]|nr:ABC transporter substrate-binding protein [Candidatus Omnitrophota bacterium]
MRKFLGGMCFFLLMCLVPVMALAGTPGVKKRIGILLSGDEARYQENMSGFFAMLSANGFPAGDMEIITENAHGHKARARLLAEGFAVQKMDAYLVLGTNAAVAMSKEVKEAPIIFCPIYDPVAAGLVASLEKPGNNLTGVTNGFSMARVIEPMKKLFPLKSLAVLYTPGVLNSEAQVKGLENVAQECGVKIIPVPLASEQDAVSTMAFLKGKAEAVYLTGGGVVGASCAVIIRAALKEGLVPVTHLTDYVGEGALIGIGVNMTEIGRLAAQQMLEVFKGRKPANIPVIGPQNLEVYLNVTTAKKLGIDVPAEFKKSATRIME